MLNKHLNEEEAQQFALDSAGFDVDIKEHVHACEECKARIENYRLLFTGIRHLPQPTFDFNLSELVVAKIHQPQKRKSSETFFQYIFTLVTIIIMGVGLYLTRNYWMGMFETMASYTFYLIAITVIVISALVCLDLFKKYQKKINELNFY